MDYTRLSLSDIRAQLDALARDARGTFSGLDDPQLNWRPDEARWSVGQCFEHLLMTNQLTVTAMETALHDGSPRTIWQRVPILPGLAGRALIRSQAPTATRRFTAAPTARPSLSAIGQDVVPRFVEQHRDVAARVERLDERRAGRTIMTSPFLRVLTYSVLDGLRLMVAHGWRHVEQARRVTLAQGFPISR